MRKPLIAFALIFPLRFILAAPEIAMITEPACNGEAVVITGEGFIPGKTDIICQFLQGPIKSRRRHLQKIRLVYIFIFIQRLTQFLAYRSAFVKRYAAFFINKYT